MKIFIIVFIVVICFTFFLFCVLSLPKKCDKCNKRKVYGFLSTLIKEETRYKDVRKEQKVKDKKGNEHVEVTIEHNVPYTYREYENTYKCDNCSNTYSVISTSKIKYYNDFNSFSHHLKSKYIGASIFFLLTLIPLIIGLTKIEIQNRQNSDDCKLQTYINKVGNDDFLLGNSSTFGGFDNVKLAYSKNGFQFNKSYNYRMELINYSMDQYHAIDVKIVAFFNLSPNIEDKYSLFEDLNVIMNFQYDNKSSIAYVYSEFKVVAKFNTLSSFYSIKSDEYDKKYDSFEGETNVLSNKLVCTCLDELYYLCGKAGFDIYN